MNTQNINVGVIGDGGWGTTLAKLLAEKGFFVSLWGPSEEYLKTIEKKRVNEKFLPGVDLPEKLIFTADIKEVAEGSDILIFAIPSRFFRSVIARIKGTKLEGKILLSATKGIETKTLFRMTEVIEEELGCLEPAVLSGPTIAWELARGIPTTAVIASNNKDTAKKLQDIFMSETLRIYTHTDVVGVELGGSLKNVIAIACGIMEGIGFGSNTKAALVCRGIVEIARLGEILGADSETFYGLSGLGDLITTSFSPHSRNRTVGERIGKGEKISHITEDMETVAEGIDTSKSAFLLSKREGVEMPIIQRIYQVIYEGKSPKTAVGELMLREKKSEKIL